LSKITLKLISIHEAFLAPSFLLEIYKVSLVLLALDYVDSVSLSFAVPPLSIVTITVFVCPDTDSMPIAVLPLADIVLPIYPLELSVSVALVIEELALV
jgi:hypothetical protein